MRCLLEERSIEKDNWPSILQEVSYNLNCLPSSSTGYPPYTVMYGVATTSLSMTCLPRSKRGGGKVTTQEWLEEVTNARGVVNSNGNSNLSESHSRMKYNYRCSTSPTNVQAGDKVLLKNEPRSDGLEPCFREPYTVTERMGVNVRVQINERKKKVVHLNKCKLYQPPPDMYIPFQPTREIRPSLSTREEVASEAETEIVPES